jgi:NifU-like protein
MWDYSEKVKEHFFNPKNVGALADANAIGDVGSLTCGDALRLTLKIDPSTETILEAGFQTFGCGSAIASSSALTEMIKGKTINEVTKITNQDIADYLDGLPPEKMHCSVMGREALHAAIANYRGETWEDDHEEGALVCKCFGIDAAMIERTIRDNHLKSLTDIINYTKAGGGCSSCHETLEEILAQVLAEQGEYIEQEEPPVTITSSKPYAMTNLQRMRRIETVLESLRPQLHRDNGDIELVDIDGKTVYVNLTGACAGCQLEMQTLFGIQQRLTEEIGEPIKVIPAKMREQLIKMEQKNHG